MHHPRSRPGPVFIRHLPGAGDTPLRTFFLLALILLTSRPDGWSRGWGDLLPAEPAPVAESSNWLAAVKTVLPANDFTNGNFDVHQITNRLCTAGQQGNVPAQALWAIAVMLSGPRENVDAGVERLRHTADEGCIPAMVQLGFMYEQGRYVRKNYDLALHWFGLAAGAGDAEGEAELGGLYHVGLGTKPNFFMAAKFYRQAADQTNYVAMKSLGVLLMNGMGVPKDLKEAKYWLLRSAIEGNNRRAMYDLGVLCGTNASFEAFQWFKRSADLDDPLGAFEVARFYYAGWAPGGTNLDSFHYWRARAASLGSTEAQYEMGAAYRTGDGVPQDDAKSLAWYLKAAAKNHPEANYDLALYYLRDKIRPARRTAQEYMRAAAEGGNREAQLQFAMGCFRGDSGAVDFDLGREWLAKSATNGWAKAEFTLFELYYNGRTPALNCPPYPQDKVAAVEWLRRAALHGYLPAQSTFAVMQIRGLDIVRDPVSAENLLRNAAALGDARAQNDLGFALENQDIPAKDPLEAAVWLRLAQAHPPDTRVAQRVEINLKNALAQLTPAQIEEVNRRVAAFRPLPEPALNPLTPGWEKNPDYKAENRINQISVGNDVRSF